MATNSKSKPDKNPAAVALGRLGGLKGGPLHADLLVRIWGGGKPVDIFDRNFHGKGAGSQRVGHAIFD
jgi:hypothetical protein